MITFTDFNIEHKLQDKVTSNIKQVVLNRLRFDFADGNIALREQNNLCMGTVFLQRKMEL